MKLLFSIAVWLFVTVPIVVLLIWVLNASLLGSGVIGLIVGLVVTWIGGKIWDLIKGEKT